MIRGKQENLIVPRANNNKVMKEFSITISLFKPMTLSKSPPFKVKPTAKGTSFI